MDKLKNTQFYSNFLIGGLPLALPQDFVLLKNQPNYKHLDVEQYFLKGILHFVALDDLDSLKRISACGYDFSEKLKEFLIASVTNKSLDCAKYFIALDKKIKGYHYYETLRDSVMIQDKSYLQTLLELSPDRINVRHTTALDVAAQFGENDAIEMMIKYGVKTRSNSYTAVIQALNAKHYSTASLMIEDDLQDPIYHNLHNKFHTHFLAKMKNLCKSFNYDFYIYEKPGLVANRNSNYTNLLKIALENKHYELVDRFLNLGIDCTYAKTTENQEALDYLNNAISKKELFNKLKNDMLDKDTNNIGKNTHKRKI